MKKLVTLGLCVCLTFTQMIQAEVEQVEINWNAFKCQDTCVPLIERNLKAISEVSNIQTNAASGAAVMAWNPNAPFSYEPFRYASAAVGIHISQMRVRVRGTISHDYGQVYLNSNGDGTRFILVGPIATQPGRYSPRYNPATHPLSPQVIEQLIATEPKGLTVVISGPLLLPSHYPLTLITEQIKVNAKENDMDPRYKR